MHWTYAKLGMGQGSGIMMELGVLGIHKVELQLITLVQPKTGAFQEEGIRCVWQMIP